MAGYYPPIHSSTDPYEPVGILGLTQGSILAEKFSNTPRHAIGSISNKQEASGRPLADSIVQSRI